MIFAHLYDPEVPDLWSEIIGHGLGVSTHAAHRLIAESDVIVEVWAHDKVAFYETRPRMVRALLEGHDGIASDGSRVWTSTDLRAGRADGLESRRVPTIAEEYERSDAVFVGEVVSEQRVPESTDSGSGVLLTLNVDEVLRGTLPRTVRVFNQHDRPSFSMVVGKTYILFVLHSQSRTVVDVCGNSGSLPAATDTLAAVRRMMQHR